VFIKTAATGTQPVVLHVLDGPSGYQQLSSYVTGFDAAEGPKGTWMIARYVLDRPGPDLVRVKTRDTGSGQVEVHFRSHDSRYQKGESITSLFPASLGPKGTWLAVKLAHSRRSDAPDLVLVETAYTSIQEAASRVTVHARSFEGGFKPPVENAPWGSHYGRSDAGKGTWLVGDMARDGGEHPPDLVFVRTTGTDSGNVELSYATGASRYRDPGRSWVTGFPTDDAALGTWQLADMDGDGRLDLVFVKTAGTDSGRVEIYWALAADDYANPVGGFTQLSAAEGPNGTWQVVQFE
jgi:hypothetical protein